MCVRWPGERHFAGPVLFSGLLVCLSGVLLRVRFVQWLVMHCFPGRPPLCVRLVGILAFAFPFEAAAGGFRMAPF